MNETNYVDSRTEAERIRDSNITTTLKTSKIDSFILQPSPRLDYCIQCGHIHGFDCPLDKDLEVKFNEFIKDWVRKEDIGHLLDSDQNDGEKIRELIREVKVEKGIRKEQVDNLVRELNDSKKYIRFEMIKQLIDLKEEARVGENWVFNGQLMQNRIQEIINTLII